MAASYEYLGTAQQRDVRFNALCNPDIHHTVLVATNNIDDEHVSVAFILTISARKNTQPIRARLLQVKRRSHQHKHICICLYLADTNIRHIRETDDAHSDFLQKQNCEWRYLEAWGLPGIEPGTTRTLSEYHTTRPKPQLRNVQFLHNIIV